MRNLYKSIGCITLFLLLSNCVYPTTYFKPSAMGGRHPATSCPGNDEYLYIEKEGAELNVFAANISEGFYIYISVKKLPQKVTLDLSQIKIIDKVSGAHYSPLSYEELVAREDPSIFESNLKIIPITPESHLETGSYIRLEFSNSIWRTQKFSLQFPYFFYKDRSSKEKEYIVFPEITFEKKNEFRAFVINC